VSGLKGHTESNGAMPRPAAAAERATQILAAIPRLPEADDEAWLPDGRPNRFALSTILGWPVAEADRDSVMSMGDGEPSPVQEDATTVPPKRSVVVRRSRTGVPVTAAPAAPAPAATSPAIPAPAVAAAVPTTEPSVPVTDEPSVQV
jgi:hypothetical protein